MKNLIIKFAIALLKSQGTHPKEFFMAEAAAYQIAELSKSLNSVRTELDDTIQEANTYENKIYVLEQEIEDYECETERLTDEKESQAENASQCLQEIIDIAKTALQETGSF